MSVKKVGVLYGMENTFPGALIEEINARKGAGVEAESVTVGGVLMDRPCGYDVIIDRISQDVPFYRAYLKNAALFGARIVNNPFWWSADDKFFNYALSAQLGVATPRTVLLPHKEHPPDTTERSMRNLAYPLNWQEVFDYIGFPAFLKPHAGGGWKHVYHVHNPEELYAAYDQTGTLCMTLQQAIDFKEYFRCYVVGQQQVHIMQYDPKQPHANRYVKDGPPIDSKLLERVERDSLTLCRALGYDINTVEFAVQDGVPYAIDFLNPAPDGDYHSVGEDNFHWFVNAVADFAITEALKAPVVGQDLRWARFLDGAQQGACA